MWTNIRTDLAMEAREMAQERSRQEIPGVNVENVYPAEDISITRVEVVSRQGEENLGKPMGNYITMKLPASRPELEYEEEVKQHLANEIRRLVDLRDDSVIRLWAWGTGM